MLLGSSQFRSDCGGIALRGRYPRKLRHRRRERREGRRHGVRRSAIFGIFLWAEIPLTLMHQSMSPKVKLGHRWPGRFFHVWCFCVLFLLPVHPCLQHFAGMVRPATSLECTMICANIRPSRHLTPPSSTCSTRLVFGFHPRHSSVWVHINTNTALSKRKTRARTFFSRSSPRRAWPRSPCTSRCTCGSTATMRRSWCSPRCATGGYSCFSARWRYWEARFHPRCVTHARACACR